jgi:uncharacterized protein YbjT (DUF2867 family)
MILVTGATGTAGREVVAALERAKVPILRATRSSEPVAGERWFDSAEPNSWPGAFEGITAVFLMLPPGLPKARERFRRLLAAARAAGVERTTFLSIRNADRLAFLPHRGVEHAIEASGTAWTHLRANDWMQNFATQPLYRQDIASGGLWAPNGRSRTSYVDVRDVAAVAATALLGGQERRALVLTGPAPLAAVMTSIGLVARLGLAKGVEPDIETILGRKAGSFARFVADYRETWLQER